MMNCNLSIHSNSINKEIISDSLKFGIYKIKTAQKYKDRLLIRIGEIEFIKK